MESAPTPADLPSNNPNTIAPVITPYVFPYGARYRYNSPGPVYYQLEYWGPGDRCRLWRRGQHEGGARSPHLQLAPQILR